MSQFSLVSIFVNAENFALSDLTAQILGYGLLVFFAFFVVIYLMFILNHREILYVFDISQGNLTKKKVGRIYEIVNQNRIMIKDSPYSRKRGINLSGNYFEMKFDHKDFITHQDGPSLFGEITIRDKEAYLNLMCNQKRFNDLVRAKDLLQALQAMESSAQESLSSKIPEVAQAVMDQMNQLDHFFKDWLGQMAEMNLQPMRDVMDALSMFKGVRRGEWNTKKVMNKLAQIKAQRGEVNVESEGEPEPEEEG